MSMIFNFDARLGSLRDTVSNIKGTLTAGTGGFKQTEKGQAMLFDGSATDIDSGVTLTGVKTIIMFIKPIDNTKILLDDGSDKLEITGGSYSGTGLTENYVNNLDSDVAVLNEWQMSESQFSGGIDFSTDLEVTPTTKTYIARIICFDALLTTQERNDLMEEFQHSFNLYETKYAPSPVLKQTDLSKETGLVASYNMIPSGDGVLTDTSGNGNTGTISGALSDGKGSLVFDGVDDKEVLGNLGNVKSVSFRIKLATTTEQILEGAANDKLILASAGTLTYAEFDNAYINGSDNDTISAGLWHNVVITSSTDVDMSACTLALNDTSYGAFDIADLNFYNYELTPTQAKAYHNSFQEVYFRDNMIYDGADGIVGTKDPFITGTGTYFTDEMAIADSVLTDLKVGTKYLECDSAGTTAVQSKQAYGEWEFDLYKGGAGNSISVSFLDSNTNSADNGGYRINISSDEKLSLINSGISILFVTAASYIDNNTYYRLKVARLSSEGVFPDISGAGGSVVYPANTFAVFIKGGDFGDTNWTLVDPSGGSGTNPVQDTTYTTSEYFVADLDDGDRIANIKMKNIVEQ